MSVIPKPSIVIKKKDTYFLDKIKLCEPLNKKQIEAIELIIKGGYINTESTGTLEKFLKMKQKKCDYIYATYYRPRLGFGRSICSNGMTNLPRNVRNLIFRDFFTDFDLVNAQHIILLRILEGNPEHFRSIEFQNLQHYCEHRNEIFEEHMSRYQLPKANIKELFNRIICNGSFTGWVTDIKRDWKSEWGEVTRNFTETPFVCNYIREIQDIITKLINLNPELFTLIKRNYKTENKKGSFMSVYLQEHEVQIIDSIFSYIYKDTNLMKMNELKVGTYEFDGIKLLTTNVQEFGGINAVIDLFQRIALENTGLNVEFIAKPMSEILEVPGLDLSFVSLENKMEEKNEDYLESRDDNDASNQFIKAYGNNLFYLNDKYYFCHRLSAKDPLIYVNDLEYIKAKILSDVMATDIRVKLDDGVTKSYWRNFDRAQRLVKTILAKVMSSKNTTGIRYQDFHTTTKCTLAFRDGVLYFKDFSFQPWEKVNNYYTTQLIDMDFGGFMALMIENDSTIESEEDSHAIEKIQTAIDTIKKKILEPMFGDKLDIALNFFSRALAGHNEDKNYATYLGNRDCGKGVLNNLFSAFGPYVRPFDIKNVMCSRQSKGFIDNSDTNRKMYWTMDFEFVRLAISQESPKTEDKMKINSQLWKKLNSGGDSLVARRNYDTHDSIFTMDTSFFCLGNDPIQMDGDLKEHLIEFTCTKQFKTVDEINYIRESLGETVPEVYFDRFMERDPSIKDLVQSELYQKAFILIIAESYKSFPVSIIPEIGEDILEDNVLFNFLKTYTITRNEEDFIPTSEFERLELKKLKPELIQLGVKFKKHTKSGHYRNQHCIYGIKLKTEIEQGVKDTGHEKNPSVDKIMFS